MIFNYEKNNYDINDKYSFQDFTGQDLSKKKDMNDIIIYASCFSQEIPDSENLPSDIVGVTFIKCNLMNCFIPDGNTVIDCNTKKFKVQNDLRDWELDVDNKPIKLIGEKYWMLNGYSIDPLDIPEEKLASIKDVKKV